MISDAAILCLALNIYHEARGEPIEGQFAVAFVTLNRAQFAPDRVCKEVYRPHQFSWTTHKPTVHDKKAFKHCKKVARLAFSMQDFTKGANHFHALHVNPKWANKLTYIGRWGHHKFYRG